jgi:hypothetical protein
MPAEKIVIFIKAIPMKKFLLFLSSALYACGGFAQDNAYNALVDEAEKLYNAKEYLRSGQTYSKAFAANDGKGFVPDRYNAACSWALAGNKDSAFVQLEKIARNGNYSNLNHMLADTDLSILHNDKKWDEVVAIVKKNKDKKEENLNKPLVAMLDTVMMTDQKPRMQIDEIEKKYGRDSKEMREHWALIQKNDSVNLIKVTSILDKHGWLGADVIGTEGNQALFLVIQHADLATQQKYLPMMQAAVKNRKASPGSLALLEDRVALRTGKKQIYGSQVGMDDAGKPYVMPLEDPDNVDKRRAEVGLRPLADYVNNWQMKWDPAEYKKQLPAIEAMEKKRKEKQAH